MEMTEPVLCSQRSFIMKVFLRLATVCYVAIVYVQHSRAQVMPPMLPGFHKPILKELSSYGFQFQRRTQTI